MGTTRVRVRVRFLTVTSVILASLLLFILIGLTGAQAAETFTLNDDQASSLITAINNANANAAEPAIIELLPGGDYVLTSVQHDGADGHRGSGLPLITSNITIKGNGATIRRDATSEDSFRILRVGYYGNLTIENVTIRDGYLDAPNSVEVGGGGIMNEGLLTIRSSTVRGNYVSGWLADAGGGVYTLDGQTTIINSTITDNEAGSGAGLAVRTFERRTTLTVINSTVSGNRAVDYGGGIYQEEFGWFGGTSTLSLVNTTITENSAERGGGVDAEGSFSTAGSIVAGNTADSSPDVRGAVSTDIGFNLIGDGTGMTGLTHGENGNFVGDPNGDGVIDPRLGPLQDNGGLTLTHLPGEDSPAIDAFGNSVCTQQTDQRGISRPQGLRCDIGSVEIESSGSGPADDDDGITIPPGPDEPTSIILVDASNTGGTQNGATWDTAFSDLQAALAEAQVRRNGGQERVDVWVAGGTYYPSAEGVANRQHAFEMRIGINIFGGFSGNEDPETQGPEDRDLSNPDNETILSGNIDRATDGDNTNNSFSVVTSFFTYNAVLDGVTVTAGNASGSAQSDTYQRAGGGIHALYSTIGLANVTVTGNAAYIGAGIYANESTLTISNSTVSHNEAVYRGGGLYLFLDTEATISDSEISSNVSATGEGGAMFIDAGEISIARSTINHNSADSIGGAIRQATGSLTISDSTVHDNESSSAGGGIDVSAPLNIQGSTFSSNRAGHQGGGINMRGPGVVANSTFTDNYTSLYGGGIYVEGDADLTLEFATIVGNYANDRGGGLANYYGGNLEIIASVIAGNTARVASPQIWGTLNVDRGFNQIGGNVNLMLEPLSDNGGRTVTMLPFPSRSNPLIDAIPEPECLEIRDVDQRGITRPQLESCDIGAVEFDGTLPDLLPHVYVDGSATGAGDGTSWANAFTDLRAALFVAGESTSQFDTVEVWVAAGTYVPTTNQAERTVSFTLYDGVQVYGGFNGTEVDLDQRDWVLNETILSGQITSSVSSYTVVYGEGLSSSTRLDGFTITGGNSDFGSNPLNRNWAGGGIYLTNASPALANLVVTGNRAIDGGGIYLTGNSSTPATSNVRIVDNIATVGGGGIRVQGSNNAVLTDLTIVENHGELGGGILFSGSSATLSHSVIAGNRSTNTLNAGHGYGGGFYSEDSSPRFINVTITGNHAVHGGAGAFNENESPTFINVTIAGNNDPLKHTFAIRFRTSMSAVVLTFRNSIIWDNSGSLIYNYATNSFSGNHFYDTIIEGGCATAPPARTCQNSQGTDPHFIAPVAQSSAPTAAGDYGLLPGSTAINAGSNAAYTNVSSVTVDLAGGARIVDGQIDRGAYEAQFIDPELVISTSDAAITGQQITIDVELTAENVETGFAEDWPVSLEQNPTYTGTLDENDSARIEIDVPDEPGEFSVVARIGGLTSNTLQLEAFGPPDSIELEADDETPTVDTDVTITATVSDEFGNAVANGTVVTFSVDGDGAGSATWDADAEITQTTDGVATFTYSNTTAGVDTVTATIELDDTDDLTESIQITWQAGDPASFTLELNESTLTVGQTNQATVSNIQDAFGNAVPDGVTVTFSLERTDGDPANWTTSDETVQTENGVATFTFSTTVVGTDTVTAGIEDVDTEQETVTWLPGEPHSIDLDAGSGTPTVDTEVTITATVSDEFDNLVANGTVVTFSVAGDGAGSATWDADAEITQTTDGVATFTYSNTTAGVDTVTATIELDDTDDLTESIQITWQAGDPASFTLELNETTLTVGQTNQATVSNIQDAFGNAVPDGVTVTFSLERTDGNPANWTTSDDTVQTENGVATFTFSTTVVGVDTLTVSIAGVGTEQETVTWLPDEPHSIDLDADNGTPTVDTEVTITATVSDEFGNLVANGTVVTFSVDGDGASSATWETDAEITQTTDGVATFTYSNTTAGVDTVTATIELDDTDDLTESIQITWQAGDPASFTLALDEKSLPVGQTNQATVSNIEDAFGNAVPDGATVTFSLERTDGNPANWTTSDETVQTENGEAIFTFSTTVVGVDTLTVSIEDVGSEQETVTWLPGAPAQISIEASDDQPTVGRPVDVTATVTDEFGNRTGAGGTIAFSVSGANQSAGDAVLVGDDVGWSVELNGDGSASIRYYGLRSGEDTVSADLDEFDIDHVDSATIDWRAPELSFVESTLSETVGNTVTLTVDVTDGSDPVEDGVVIEFAVEGANTDSAEPDSGTRTTEGGQVSFSYVNTAAGTDTVRAGYQVLDDDNSDATATVSWRPGEIAAVSVSALPRTQFLGRLVTVTASATDQYGNAVRDGTEIIFTVDREASAFLPDGETWNATTQGGRAFIQYGNNAAGSDVVTAESGGLRDSTNVNWIADSQPPPPPGDDDDDDGGENPAAPLFRNVPEHIVIDALSQAGAIVHYDQPTATDHDGTVLDVTCEPPSGSWVPIGHSDIVCSAIGSTGLTTTVTFGVTVRKFDWPDFSHTDQIDNPWFWRTWARTDLPVRDLHVSRTWMWGPGPFTGSMWESYTTELQNPGGDPVFLESHPKDAIPETERETIYFDKARMEINDPDGDSDSIWFVTNGLLVIEMITGNRQFGDDLFIAYEPSYSNVAGDADDINGPTYASFQGVLDAPAQSIGTLLTEQIDRYGNVTTSEAWGDYNVSVEYVDDVTNHSIAEPFWEFMNSHGLIYSDGNLLEEALFENPFYATGRPVTEAYWAEVKVAGAQRDVLIQCFERRCLTYTPGNSEGFVVEAGNVGQHYYHWRYVQAPD